MKKGLKAFLSIVLAGAMIFGATACGGGSDSSGGEEAAAEEGKVLNIWCWNDEFQTRFNDYYPEVSEVAEDGSTTTLSDGTVVNWVIEPNQDNNYQIKLDEALLNQANADADSKIDIFLVEADYARKYTNSEVTMPVEDLGVLEATSDQYDYTKEVVSDASGVVKGVSWQACPGLIAYRRSIAKEVLGSDDPETVQAALADWDTFKATAQKMKDAGYVMLSGYDDTFRPFYNNDAAPFVEDGKTLNIDQNIMDWVAMTKEYTDAGFNNKTSLWSAEWAADQGKDAKVFCIPACTWEIDFTLTGNADPDGTQDPEKSAWGDYAVCVGPVSWCWGGTWITAAAGTDNPTLVADVMTKMTTDADILNKIATEKGDFVNSQSVIADLAANYEGNSFLGGQNHYALLSDSAAGLSLKIASPYDQGVIEKMQAAMKDYFDGNADLDTAKANFETSIKELYPEIETVNWPE